MLQTVKMHPEVLSLPPSQMQLRFATLDERAVASYWANLYIQTADIHLHTELKNLDYPRTIEWLKVAKTIKLSKKITGEIILGFSSEFL